MKGPPSSRTMPTSEPLSRGWVWARRPLCSERQPAGSAHGETPAPPSCPGTCRPREERDSSGSGPGAASRSGPRRGRGRRAPGHRRVSPPVPCRCCPGASRVRGRCKMSAGARAGRAPAELCHRTPLARAVPRADAAPRPCPGPAARGPRRDDGHGRQAALRRARRPPGAQVPQPARRQRGDAQSLPPGPAGTWMRRNSRSEPHFLTGTGLMFFSCRQHHRASRLRAPPAPAPDPRHAERGRCLPINFYDLSSGEDPRCRGRFFRRR